VKKRGTKGKSRDTEIRKGSLLWGRMSNVERRAQKGGERGGKNWEGNTEKAGRVKQKLKTSLKGSKFSVTII